MKNLIAMSFALATFFSLAQPVPAAEPSRRYTREDYMMLNLTRGSGSAGVQISENLKSLRDVLRSLNRALSQVETTDKVFAKSKGRPDDRYLSASSESIKKALQTAEQLEKELTRARDGLKDNVHEALVITHP